MSPYESRYRALLRLLPADYRAAWADEMVATFLETTARDDPEEAAYQADFGRPSWPEAASVLALAVRLRLGGVGAGPRYRIWGDALRLIALTGLLAQSVLATVGLVNLLWAAGKLPGVPAPPYPPPGQWQAFRVLLECAAVPAYVALLLGHRRAGRLLAALAVGTVWVAPWTASRAALLLPQLGALLALAAFHRDAPPVRPRPWLVALPLGAGLVLALVLVDGRRAWPVLDPVALSCLALIGAALVHLVRRGDRPAWSLALALLALVLSGQRIVTLYDYAWNVPVEHHDELVRLGVLEAAATLAVAVPLVVLAVRGLRRSATTPQELREV